MYRGFLTTCLQVQMHTLKIYMPREGGWRSDIATNIYAFCPYEVVDVDYF